MKREFTIDSLDAAEIARYTAEARASRAEAALAGIQLKQAEEANKKAIASLNAIYDGIRAKAGLPDGCDFTWDETGLNGSAEVPDEKEEAAS